MNETIHVEYVKNRSIECAGFCDSWYYVGRVNRLSRCDYVAINKIVGKIKWFRDTGGGLGG